MIIAVDGPAAAGKGTLARRLAEHFDFAYLETGALYRAVGLAVLSSGGDPENLDTAAREAQALRLEQVENPVLREEWVGEVASKVATMPEVREVLLKFQRTFAFKPPGGKTGAVLDGRDIGTVVCPNAAAKFFLVARPEIRAIRRVKQLRETGSKAIHRSVLRDIKNRDKRDKSRDVAPLVPARDALVLDTSELDADSVFAVALEFINAGDPEAG